MAIRFEPKVPPKPAKAATPVPAKRDTGKPSQLKAEPPAAPEVSLGGKGKPAAKGKRKRT